MTPEQIAKHLSIMEQAIASSLERLEHHSHSSGNENGDNDISEEDQEALLDINLGFQSYQILEDYFRTTQQK